MNQAREDASGCQSFQIFTRFTQTPSGQSHRAYLKLAPHEMIQGHPARHEVSARRSRCDHNIFFALECLDGLDFDQRDLTTYAGCV